MTTDKYPDDLRLDKDYEQINHPNGVTTWKTKPKEQPEALRLADELEADQQGIDLGAEGMGWGPSKTARTKAAAKLRRLHALNQELLEALTSIAKNSCCDRCQEAALVAKAALAKAQGASNE